MIFGALLRPLQAIAVALISLASLWSPRAALAVGAFYTVMYAHHALSAPRDLATRARWEQSQRVPGGPAATIALNAGLGLVFPLALLLLPEFETLMQWALAVFIGYYAGTVLSMYTGMWSEHAIRRQLVEERLRR